MDLGERHVTFAHKAAKAFQKLPLEMRRRIAPRIEVLKHNPRPPGCEKLEGFKGVYRIRVGDYRIVYEIIADELSVVVAQIGHRRDIYKGL